MGCGLSKAPILPLVNVMNVEEMSGEFSSMSESRPSETVDTSTLSPFSWHCPVKHQLYVWDKYSEIVEYHVDKKGMIVKIPTPNTWDAAAKVGCADLSIHAVLGQNICQFMTKPLAAFYMEVIGALHLTIPRSSVSFRWFCDSPIIRREIVLVMVNLGNTVAILSINISEVPHDADFLGRVVLVDKSDRKNCVFCNRYLWDGRWLLPTDFGQLLKEEPQHGPLLVSTEVCPECSDHVVSPIAPTFFKDRRCHKGRSLKVLNGLSTLNSFCALPPSMDEALLAHLRSLRVLVVNDDMVTARVLEALLRGLGHQPVVVCVRADVSKFLQDNAVNVIFVDLVFASGAGCEVITELSRMPSRVPIVALSSCAGSRYQAIRAGAKDFLMKPVTGRCIQGTLEPYSLAKAAAATFDTSRV